MNKKEIFEKYKTIPMLYECDNCKDVSEYVLNVGPQFKPFDICEYCFLKDTFTLSNVRDLINLLRFSTGEKLNENINCLIRMIDKEIKEGAE